MGKEVPVASSAVGKPAEPSVGGKAPIAQDIEPTSAAHPPSIIAPQQPPPPSVPVAAVAVAAAAPAAHHPHAALDSTARQGVHGPRTESPAVATSANAAVAPSAGHYHHSYQPWNPSYAHTTTPAYPTSVPYPTTNTSSMPPAGPPLQPESGLTSTPQQPSVPSSKTIHQSIDVPRERRPPSPVKVNLSPRGEVRERESYGNVSSLIRSSAPTSTAPQHSFQSPPAPAPVPPSSSSLTAAAPTAAPAVQPPPPLVSKPWVAPVSAAAAPVIPTPVATRMSPVPPRPTPPLHSTAAYPGAAAPPPMFAPPPAAPAAPAPAVGANPNPFSAESLFQTNQADMLRRELDNRFLASQDHRALGVGPSPYLRTEMHQHQHHHTHVHQHTTSLLPPPGASALFSSHLPMSPMERLARGTQSSFKDIPKLGGVDSSFYRQNLAMPSYTGYSPSLIGHPGLTPGPTPFMPPNHLPTFQPKSLTSQEPSKSRIMKTGKWNAMHVRVAWEIYHHQQKSGEAKAVLASAVSKSAAAAAAATDLLRTPSHLFSPNVHSTATARPHDLSGFPPSAAALTGHRPGGFDQPPHHSAGSLFSAPPGHLGWTFAGKSPFSSASSISPFTRYGATPLVASTTSPFSVSPFATSRDSHLGLGPLHHDPWRSLQRTLPGFPPSVNPLPPSLPGRWLPPGPAPWAIKPDPVLEQREREAREREREERERERLRREREERERREREEKQRRLEQQQQQERERERREKERREMERRENERREREMLLHQQRLAAESAAKQMAAPPVIRDRSPLRSNQPDLGDIRVKEEPRTKEEDLLARTDARYHSFLRHPANLQPPPPPSILDRSRMMAAAAAAAHALPPHYAPAAHWPPPPVTAADAFYRYGGYAAPPLVDERQYFGAAYGHPGGGHLRPKDASLMHLRGGPGPPAPPPGHKMSVTPPTEIHKKEEPR